MGREARRKDSAPHLPPIQKIELSSAHSGRRMATAIVLLAVGVVALVYAFTGLFTTRKGWQQIEVSSGAEANCGADFALLYDIGSSDVSASAEKRGLTAAYTEAAVKAYQLFDSAGAYDGICNVWYINHHPNETVAVDPALYRALEQVQAAGDRSLYLGPVYEIYDGIFACDDDWQTADYDPRQNDSLREYFARCSAFGRDPASVDVELLDGGQVRLCVSEEYLAFAREQEIGSFIDFYWMKNAFIADCMADDLTAKGYTRGALSSFDGFVRNLYSGEETFGVNIYDRRGQAATMSYTGPMSIVYLRSYPMNAPDSRHYYEMEDGQVCSAYVDSLDGLSRTAVDDLVAYTGDGGCGAALLALSPLYVAEELDEAALSALAEEGIFSIRCKDGKVLYNDPDLTIAAAEGYETAYYR